MSFPKKYSMDCFFPTDSWTEKTDIAKSQNISVTLVIVSPHCLSVNISINTSIIDQIFYVYIFCMYNNRNVI